MYGLIACSIAKAWAMGGRRLLLRKNLDRLATSRLPLLYSTCISICFEGARSSRRIRANDVLPDIDQRQTTDIIKRRASHDIARPGALASIELVADRLSELGEDIGVLASPGSSDPTPGRIQPPDATGGSGHSLTISDGSTVHTVIVDDLQSTAKLDPWTTLEITGRLVSRQPPRIQTSGYRIYGTSDQSNPLQQGEKQILQHPYSLPALERERCATRPAGQRGSLITVCFDQRNHGLRLISTKANTNWLAGNKNAAAALFSTYQGTTADVSTLVDFLPCYLPAEVGAKVEHHIIAGDSLGGHAAWQVVLHEPRVNAAVIFIGCPDFIRLMSWRAEEARLPSLSNGLEGFLGSEDFPPAPVEAISQNDPAASSLGKVMPLSTLQHTPSRGRRLVFSSRPEDRLTSRGRPRSRDAP
ncbi:uncharacterized protein LTR77_008648 [Saxophila tyrrhenica]|uniref:Uncharacterized protein n=1 Tax=Saxophila tyrrhenica TaxID=1690608 RepID=A0AAV9NZW1_9PEZI|nr:hypothetical protein LTR77_008648 [Saxophila tyrrhenica]